MSGRKIAPGGRSYVIDEEESRRLGQERDRRLREPPRPLPGQTSIWDGWAPVAGPDENSRIAAESMIDVAGKPRRQVAEYIAAHGPVAEWEVSEALGHMRASTTPRIFELHQAGVITRHEVKGLTPSGRPCWRYVVPPFWRAYLEEHAG